MWQNNLEILGDRQTGQGVRTQNGNGLALGRPPRTSVSTCFFFCFVCRINNGSCGSISFTYGAERLDLLLVKVLLIAKEEGGVFVSVQRFCCAMRRVG